MIEQDPNRRKKNIEKIITEDTFGKDAEKVVSYVFWAVDKLPEDIDFSEIDASEEVKRMFSENGLSVEEIINMDDVTILIENIHLYQNLKMIDHIDIIAVKKDGERILVNDYFEESVIEAYRLRLSKIFGGN